MLKAIIIDDVKEFRDTINRIVSEFNPDIKIVAQADCITAAEIEIKKHQPDLIFLDVEMPDGTGFDLLKKLNPFFFKVIFVTAFEDFSIRAFKYSAVDYILKPIDKGELQDAINRARETIDKESLNTKFSSLLSNVSGPSQLPQKLVLKTTEHIFAVNVDDIVRCEADESYTVFYLTGGKKILISKTLKVYDELLAGQNFFRPHHSHLINMKFFDYFVKTDGGTIIMKDESKVPVSSRKRDELLKLIEHLQ